MVLKNFYRVSMDKANGTSLKTHIEATWQELQLLLGNSSESDGYKVSGEWAFINREGDVVTIYDWKATSLYDEDLPTPEEFRAQGYPSTFSIGGHTAVAAETFRHELQLQLLKLRKLEDWLDF